MLRRDSASSKTPEGGSGDVKAKEPSIYTILQRVSVVIGLLAIVPLTRIWDRSWWIRVLFVVIAVALLAATTYDLLPRWSRRRPFALGVLLLLALAAALAPEVLGGKDRPAPDTAGRATITSPRKGESIDLTVREAGGSTNGFVASGTCEVPRGYRALIVSRAISGTGYWLHSDEILSECVDDGAPHQWTARRVDPSWGGMDPDQRITLGVIILRKELAEQAQIDKANGDPLKLPDPAASVEIFVSRVQHP